MIMYMEELTRLSSCLSHSNLIFIAKSQLEISKKQGKNFIGQGDRWN